MLLTLTRRHEHETLDDETVSLFVLTAQLDLTEREAELLETYGAPALSKLTEVAEGTSLASGLSWVFDDVLEALDFEEQFKQAVHNLPRYLATAAAYQGQERIPVTLDRPVS